MAIRGTFCPECGQERLRVIAATLVCENPQCGRPTAAQEILSDSQVEHVAVLTEEDFTIRHPLRERLDDALLRCQLHRTLHDSAGHEHAVGTYCVVSTDDGGWDWTRLA